MADVVERELDWDDEIENDGQSFEAVPPGDYDFQVIGFERERYPGGNKIPACNKAVLTIQVSNGEKSGTIKHNLLMYTTMEWKLSEFFIAIGQKKHGEKLRMNWNAVVGAAGRCKVGIHKWVNKNGEEMESGEIKKFYEPKGAPSGGRKYTPGDF